MKREFTVQPLAALILGSALLVPSSVLAATEAGVVLVSSGGVKAVGSDGKSRALNRRSAVYSGDQLVTGSGARAQVKFSDGAIVGLKPNTALRIDQYNYKPGSAESQSFMSLLKGGFRTVSGAIGKVGGGDYKVTTPVATIGIRGTLWDGEYDPETGLDLAVWDGGINACNAGGCLDLGGDVDFRYGRVNPDGTMQGLRESPIGDDEEVGDEEDESLLSQLESDMLDEDISLFLSFDEHEHDILPRGDYPYAGFATTATGTGDSNPWGDESLLNVRYARIEESDGISGWSLWSADAGNRFIVDSSTGTTCVGPCAADAPSWAYIGDDVNPETRVFWGSWSEAYGGTVDGSYTSVSDTDVSPGTDGILNAGAYVFGDYATREVIAASLTGTANFSLYNPEGPAMLVIDRNFGYASTPSFASGGLSVNMGTGTASGSLSFTDTTADSWYLTYQGTVSANGLSLALTNNTSNITGGSYYVPSGGSAGAEQLVQGTIEAAFVGKTTVDGVVGGFSAEAVTSSSPAVVTDSVTGVFVMERSTIIVTEPPVN